MSNSIVYNMHTLLDCPCDDIDCFICASHDDMRATESISKILSSGVKIANTIIIKYDKSDNDVTLKSLVKENYQEIFVSNSFSDFILQFKTIIKPYINQKIAIDISCIRVPDIFSIMKILKLNGHTLALDCIYSVPYDYEYYAGDFSYRASIGDLVNYELIGYSGSYDSTVEDATYVIFLGFEGALSLKVLEEAEYKKLAFVNGLPSLYQKYKDISVLNNRSAIKWKKYNAMLYTSADNPFEAYNLLEKQFSTNSSISISPLGTKPTALGVCLFALTHEFARVVYPVSEIYSTHSANAVIKTWVYNIHLT